MNITGIISSLLIGIGCFMPWMQFGLFFESGMNNQSSFVLIIGSIISGILGIYNQNRNESKNLWIYSVVGILGLIKISLYILDLNSKSEEITKGLSDLNKMMGSGKQVSISNILGSGIYLICFGSVGLLLAGSGALKPKESPTVPNINNIEIVSPKNFKEETKEIDPIEKENNEYKEQVIKLHEIIKNENKGIFGNSNKAEIVERLKGLSNTNKEGEYLLNVYKQLFSTDLVEDIKKTSSSYSTIQDLLDPLIKVDLIDKRFPHERRRI